MHPQPQHSRIAAVDILRGLVMVVMALDHVRLYFGHGTWYADPTNLATTTPLLFFTRWITHICAPVFVFLAGTSAHLSAMNKPGTREVAARLLQRGTWLIALDLSLVSFAWTFDIRFSLLLLQVIWAIGISMVALSGLVFLPRHYIALIGALLVLGHNLLDPVTAKGSAPMSLLWYVLHQPAIIFLNATRAVNFLYPVIPWVGLMALGYAAGALYTDDRLTERRRTILFGLGIGAILLFLVLRSFNLYGEPRLWQERNSLIISVMSFLNTTKYPPSLHFLLMTMGPTLILLAGAESLRTRLTKPLTIFGRVPLFFYVVHLYLTHALAMLALTLSGRDWQQYILSTAALRSGALSDFGFGLPTVYGLWILIIILLYPLCSLYLGYRENNPGKLWLRYL